MGDPHNPVSASTTIALWGYRLWVRLLGRKRAGVLVIVGSAISTIVVIVLQLKGV